VGQVGRPAFDPFPDTPSGKDLPIPCAYPFTATLPEGPFVEQLHSAPIPEGWSEVWMKPDDPRLKDTAFDLAEVWIDQETQTSYRYKAPGRELGAWLMLMSPEGVPVATWDEGRWWTPEEGDYFQLLLRVPGTLPIARGEYGR